MSIRSSRPKRGERAGKRARPVFFLDVGLGAPALATLLTGGYSQGAPTLPGVLALLLLATVIVKAGFRPARAQGKSSAVVAGLAALVSAFSVIELVGRTGEALYPVVLALLVVLVSLNGRQVGACLLVGCLGVEALLTWIGAGERDGLTWLVRSGLLSTFALLPAMLTSGGLRAPSPRGTASPSPALAPPLRDDIEPEGMDELLANALALVRHMTKSVVVAYLVPQGPDGPLRVVADEGSLGLRSRQVSSSGLAASVLRARHAVAANRLRGDFPGTLQVESKPGLRHVLSAPVLAGGRVLGLLMAERHDSPYEGECPQQLDRVAAMLSASLRARLRMERVTDAHYELERFFEASRLLNSSLTPDDVYASAKRALRSVADFAFAAITWAEEPGGPQRVVYAWGRGLDVLVGRRVDTERTLAAMVVKSRHYLPLGCDRPAGLPVLSAAETLGDVRSVLVLPLRVHDVVRGTLAVGAAQVGVLNDQRRGIVEVLANQVAVSLANARTFARVEEMATVDALTGLQNRRTFGLRLAQALGHARQTKGPLSLVMLDIDHFKKINDTHGHPAGDAVLRELGATVRRLQRRSDVAARYGGEEFALILEGTSSAGALVMAERLREEAAKLSFAGTDGRPFSITLSLGIASCPDDADRPETLLERADEALYEAKHGGRNQTRLARQLRPVPAEISQLRGLDPSLRP